MLQGQHFCKYSAPAVQELQKLLLQNIEDEFWDSLSVEYIKFPAR